MKRGTMLLIAAGVCSLAFQGQRADATLITIAIEAEVDYVEDLGSYLEGRINPGDIITGTYTYDSTTPDTNPSAYVGDYEHRAAPAGISLTVGGFNFASDPTNVYFLLSVCNAGGPYQQDNYLLLSYNNLPLSNGSVVDHISWQLDDPTASALSSDGLPIGPPILDQWQSIVGLRLDGERAGYIVHAYVTSAIPEPTTILLLAVGGLVLVRRQK
ncbi:MAG: PEP-CTERM sorting domain-containing protein [Planctomycetota bacterium]|jgi:hypothetical protein